MGNPKIQISKKTTPAKFKSSMLWINYGKLSFAKF